MRARYLLARLLTEVFAPAYVGAAVYLLVAWHSTSTLLGAVGWGCLTVLLTIVPGFLFVLRGVQRRQFTDHHLGLRQQRPIPLLLGLASVVVGLLLLSRLGAPPDLLAVVVAMGAGIIIALVTSFFWKLSIHTAVVAGSVVILVLVFGPPLVVLAPLVAVVGWARIEVGDHTPVEVLVGAAIGASVAASVFQLLR